MPFSEGCKAALGLLDSLVMGHSPGSRGARRTDSDSACMVRHLVVSLFAHHVRQLVRIKAVRVAPTGCAEDVTVSALRVFRD